MTISDVIKYGYPLANIGTMGFLNKWVAKSVEDKYQTGDVDVKETFKETLQGYKDKATWIFRNFGVTIASIAILAVLGLIIFKKLTK